MKKIFILALFLILTLLFVPRQTNAAVTKGIMIVTPYRTNKEMDLLFSQSTRVIVDLEPEGSNPKSLISLVNISQKNIIESKGLKPRVIDSNADLDSYVLLYNPKPDQDKVLASYGEPIIISRYYTLLKISQGKEFAFEGPIVKFFNIPFLENIQKPIIVTPVEPRISPTVLPIPVPVQKPVSGLPIFIIGGFLGILVAVSVILFLVLKRRKKASVENSNF